MFRKSILPHIISASRRRHCSVTTVVWGDTDQAPADRMQLGNAAVLCYSAAGRTRTMKAFVAAALLALLLMCTAGPAGAIRDDYDDGQSHPLRIAAYPVY